MIEIEAAVMDVALRRLYNADPRYHAIVRVLAQMILQQAWSATDLIAAGALAKLSAGEAERASPPAGSDGTSWASS